MMQNCKIANILINRIACGGDYSKLFYQSNERVVPNTEDDSYILLASTNYDFATYFNALPVKKWRQYTVAKTFKLHLEIEGEALIFLKRIIATHSDPQQEVVATQRVCFDSFSEVDLEFTDSQDADMVAFEITPLTNCTIKNCYYYTEVDDSQIKDIRLTLVTTTFRQEKYITRNVGAFKREISCCDEPFCRNINMLVIDNGQTLDASAIEGDGVRVFANPNTGGAGGFARGMIEAMRQEYPATHVLLMDDDIDVSPESFKRAYWLTALRNEEYADAFISGAMLSYEDRTKFTEDVGWIDGKGICGAVKPRMDFSELKDVMLCNSLELKRPNMYAAWWFCCIPVSTIKRCGLPLPVFFQFDDAEYGNRAKPKFMTMTGICVWHMPWGYRYKAHSARYYGTRNAFIAQAASGITPGVDFFKLLEHAIKIDLTTFNYNGVELSLNALEDYLNGPTTIMDPALVQPTLQKALALNEKLEDLGDYSDYSILTRKDQTKKMLKNPPRTFVEKAIDRATDRGHRLPDRLLNNDAVVVPHDAWTFPSKRTRLHSRVLALTPDGRQGVLRKMDRNRYNALKKRFESLTARYQAEKGEVELRYAEAWPKMTSEDFWLKYLSLD